MKILSVREFKASFSRFLKDEEEILITSRGKLVGWFRPLKPQDIVQAKKKLALRLIGLGEGAKGRVSERHDEVIYE